MANEENLGKKVQGWKTYLPKVSLGERKIFGMRMPRFSIGCYVLLVAAIAGSMGAWQKFGDDFLIWHELNKVNYASGPMFVKQRDSLAKVVGDNALETWGKQGRKAEIYLGNLVLDDIAISANEYGLFEENWSGPEQIVGEISEDSRAVTGFEWPDKQYRVDQINALKAISRASNTMFIKSDLAFELRRVQRIMKEKGYGISFLGYYGTQEFVDDLEREIRTVQDSYEKREMRSSMGNPIGIYDDNEEILCLRDAMRVVTEIREER